ncbi:FGGY family carbohydrate kinase [Arthrobacter sp. AK04]|uniref:FGGY-family carbohydrate kinase n=1 Tax=Arthrobacter sp. AK04 TaxID=2900048 RepID=UPI0027E15489|nr:FGGY family carbohydrate kinase [Arthrobacter sp. AK04]
MLPTITVDVGTTSIKLCMFGTSGKVLASARHATPTVLDTWGEIYDLEALTGAVFDFIRHLDPTVRATVKRVAITGVGESGGLVRPDLTLASPMILWHDHRGADYLARLSQGDRSQLYRITGLPANANYGLSKVAWAAEHATDAASAQWLNISEYLAAVMTGQRWSEYSLASRTMALDLNLRKWSPEICALLGLDVGVFPELRSATEGATITPDFARTIGLLDDVRVHVVGHDHMVGAIGAGLHHGELLNSTGTTEGLLFLQDAPSLDKHAEQSKLANGFACTGTDYTLFASIPTGGSAFATLQTMLGLDAAQLSACISDLHERYIAGKVDLNAIPLVLPQFRGSPPPTKRAAARGVIAGLRTDTSTEDIVLGCFLGMALQFQDVLNLFPAAPERIKVIGPASANPLWLQLKADLLGTPLSVSQMSEVVSRGAQALASDASCDWETCRPEDVLVDTDRNARLGQWSADIQPQWEYLKGLPA